MLRDSICIFVNHTELFMSNLQILSPLEARVLGVLIEKEKTVPGSYPLSVNTLTLGCNQKTARDPVMTATENEVQLAIDSLKNYALIVESSGGRVMRYAHNARRVFKLPEQSVALLAILMLRGPQTAGELRINCDRLHPFADISSVDAFLEELAAAETPWVVRLPKLLGSREHRWAHLLCGAVDEEAFKVAASSTPHSVDLGEVAALKANVARLNDEVTTLRTMVEKIKLELGL